MPKCLDCHLLQHLPKIIKQTKLKENLILNCKNSLSQTPIHPTEPLLHSLILFNEAKLNDILYKIPIFEDFNKHKLIYEQKQQELFKYFADEFSKFSSKISELQTSISNNSNSNKNTLELRKQTDNSLSKTQELKFLLTLKDQIKLLRESLEKEKQEKEVLIK